MIANMNKTNTGKLLAVVLALAMVFVGVALVMGDNVEAASNEVTIDGESYQFDSAEDLVAALTAANAAEDKTITANGDLTLPSDLNLSGLTLNMQDYVLNAGVYSITAADDNRGTIIGKGQPNEERANGMLVVLNAGSEITNIDLVMNANQSGLTAAAAIVVNGSGDVAISGCTFSVAGETAFNDFGAVQTTDAKLTITGCDFVDETNEKTGIVTFKTTNGGVLELVDSGDFYLNITKTLTLTAQNFIIADTVGTSTPTSVLGTIIGWTGSNASNVIAGDVSVTVDTDADLGKVSVGTAAGTEDLSGVITKPTMTVIVDNQADVSMYGGDENLAVTVNNGGSVTIPEGTELTGAVTNAGTLNLNGVVSGTVNNSGKTIVGPNGSADSIEGNGTVESSVVQGDANTGFKGQLNFNLTINTPEYLSDDYVIAEGYTFTIGNGGSLNLNGHKLIVNGTITVENGGSITGIGTDGEGVVLVAGGVINNTGVIGKGGNAVTVKAYLDGSKTGTPAGSVSLQNVTGISFELIRTVDSSSATYNYQLAFSGNAVRNGAGPEYAITATGAVINGDLTIGNSVKFTAQNSTTVNGATVTINGIIGGQLDLKTGSTVVLNGQTYGNVKLVANTGVYKSNTPAELSKLGTTEITIENVRGITVEVTSVSYMENKVSMTEQKMLISGTASRSADIAETSSASNNYEITVGSGTTAGTGIYVEEELYLPLSGDNDVNFVLKAMMTVTGQVSANNQIIDGSDVKGTSVTGTTYMIGTTDAVYYVTGFDQAYGQIANANSQTITVYGDLTLSGAYTVAQGQIIDITNAVDVIIDENGSVTVENGGYINGTVDTVTGVLTVVYGGVCSAPTYYDVKTTNDNGDVTYSGLAYAMGIANEGDTVNLVGKDAKVNGSLTIPAGITLDVNQGAKLTVTRNLTVNGTLLNHGTVDVQRNVTVAGKIDNTEMTGFTPASDTTGDYSVSVSGTGSIVFATVPAWTNYNGAYYTSGTETVFTTLSNAADSVAEEGIVPEITVIGTYSENATVNANGIITIATGATVSVTEIVLNGCDIDIIGTFTGSVTGQSGEEGNTVASTVQLSKASGITVSNYDQANSANVTVWYTMVTTYDDENEETTAITEFGSSTESMTVSAGVITLGDMTIKAGANAGPSVTVAAGAELVIPADIEVTSEGLLVEGTVTVEGTLTATSNTVVSGTMDIELEGEVNVTAMTVTGTVNVASQEDQTPGTLTVNGTITIGERPETLGAQTTGAVVGKITYGASGDRIVVAYAGADMSAATFDEGAGADTAYYINDQLYMTVYAVNDSTTGIDAVDAVDDIELAGLTIPQTSDETPVNDITWTDVDGKNANTMNVGSIDAVYTEFDAAYVGGIISVGNGLTMYIDDLTINNFVKSVNGYNYALSVGTHTVSIVADSGYNADAATITFNGQTVANGGTIEVTADMIQSGFTLSANGAVAESPSITIEGGSTGGDSGMGLTDYLLIILVILIVIMAIMVAFRLMRS